MPPLALRRAYHLPFERREITGSTKNDVGQLKNPLFLETHDDGLGRLGQSLVVIW